MQLLILFCLRIDLMNHFIFSEFTGVFSFILDYMASIYVYCVNFHFHREEITLSAAPPLAPTVLPRQQNFSAISRDWPFTSLPRQPLKNYEIFKCLKQQFSEVSYNVIVICFGLFDTLLLTLSSDPFFLCNFLVTRFSLNTIIFYLFDKRL